MDATRARMVQLAKKGYQCSQILIMLGLEAKGSENADLVRAIGGLAGGCIEGSCTCGSLTGGCCLLALFAGKGNDKETCDDRYLKMVTELVRWFWQKYGFNYHGIDCMAIREAEGSASDPQRCWRIMEDVYNKVIEILTSNGINLSSEECYAS